MDNTKEALRDAESYLRAKYGAYRGHPAWRELEEAFNAGKSSAPAAQELTDEPYGYVACERNGHVTFFKEEPKGFSGEQWQGLMEVIPLFQKNGNLTPIYCTPTEHEGRIVYEHTSAPMPMADSFILYELSTPASSNAALPEQEGKETEGGK